MAAEIRDLLVEEARRIGRDPHGRALLDEALSAVLDGLDRDMVGVGLTRERRADVVRLIADAAAVEQARLPELESDTEFLHWITAISGELRSRRGEAHHDGDITVPVRLLDAIGSRPITERVWFSEVMAQVLNSVLPQPATLGRRIAMKAIGSYLDSIPGRSVLYRGRPDWLTHEALEYLRKTTAAAFHRGFERYTLVEYAEVSPEVDAYIERWTEFKQWIDDRCGLKLAPHIRKVTFQYNRPTDHLPWHIDKPNKVALNCLIMLERSETRSSALQLYTASGEVQEVDLDVGEVLLFKGDATPHRRTPLVDGEFVRLMSIGFMLSSQQ
ncbi:hypothetical protein [Planobispora takensis]|uniref:2OG-Fe(II) oxygenase n=1 Tax=Planobispora takensis TaxID=1367882 RepID=A0A8J3WRJ5_9ACTN|nr:hypothetical protein [Planobispora takensis]GIH98192.1 hypothetical protein Pta02_02010 [Planobispora takensis]